jgi:hypothetical protein
LPSKIQNALMLGNQKLIDNYINNWYGKAKANNRTNNIL